MNEDGRIPLSILLDNFKSLIDLGWQMETITIQSPDFPVLAFKTPLKNSKPQKSLWIIGGIHGEEPAGPNAFSEELETINNLAKEGIPVVFIPLFNPSGYFRDWRYENEKRDFKVGQSVTDFVSIKGKTNTEVVDWVKKTALVYIPDLVFDHHEDKVDEKYSETDPHNLSSCYIYASGNEDKHQKIAKTVKQIIKDSRLPIVENGITRFDEEIIDGVVANISDGSIDEYLSSTASAVIVVETTIPFDSSLLLKYRVKAHRNIIKSYSEFWHMINL